MALKKHHRCLDKLVVALSALAEGDTDTAEEYLAEVIEDDDELRDALEDISDSQEETLGCETSGEDGDEEDEFEEELSASKRKGKKPKTDTEFYVGKDEDTGEFHVYGMETDKKYFSGTADEAKEKCKRFNNGEHASADEDEFEQEDDFDDETAGSEETFLTDLGVQNVKPIDNGFRGTIDKKSAGGLARKLKGLGFPKTNSYEYTHDDGRRVEFFPIRDQFQVTLTTSETAGDEEDDFEEEELSSLAKRRLATKQTKAKPTKAVASAVNRAARARANLRTL